MAELHAVHFLIIWTGAISAAKKRSDLETILSWMPVPCTVPDDVLRGAGWITRVWRDAWQPDA